MYKIRIFILALTLIFLVQPMAVTTSQAKESESKLETTTTAKVLDPRAEILQAYLAKFDSPLQYHAQDFIDAADKYHLDWKLVPAIAGVESTFGKQIPGGYNGWGWGVYGDQALYFGSWRDGIFTVSEGLKTRYVDRGLITPAQMNHVYASSPAWGGHVDHFVNDINKFEKNYQPKVGFRQIAYLNIDVNTSGNSAQLSTQLR